LRKKAGTGCTGEREGGLKGANRMFATGRRLPPSPNKKTPRRKELLRGESNKEEKITPKKFKRCLPV
jgi:hypothetical protein